jgi:hypothetical protein
MISQAINCLLWLCVCAVCGISQMRCCQRIKIVLFKILSWVELLLQTYTVYLVMATNEKSRRRCTTSSAFFICKFITAIIWFVVDRT